MKNLELSEVLAYSAYALLIIFFVAMSVMAAYEWRRKMPRRWKSPVLIFLSLFNSVSLVAYDIFMYGYVSGHLVSVVSLAVMPMFVSSLSYDTEKAAMYVSLPVTVSAAVLFVMKEKAMFFAGAGGLWIMPVCAIAAAAAISVVSILYPIRDMTGFICSLSVPRFFTVRLNFLYFMTYLFLMSVSSYLWTVHGTGSVIAVCLCLCLMLALAAALFVRMISDRLFIVMREKEEKMMEAAMEGLKEGSKGELPLAIGVTILTSFDQDVLNTEIGIPGSIQDSAIRLATLAKESGLKGVVCSVFEAKKIHEVLGKDFVTVCPGIRMKSQDVQDQKRVATPEVAKEEGCDFIVVGRAITASEDPVKAYHDIEEAFEND